jgi:hypothetical protein
MHNFAKVCFVVFYQILDILFVGKDLVFLVRTVLGPFVVVVVFVVVLVFVRGLFKRVGCILRGVAFRTLRVSFKNAFL